MPATEKNANAFDMTTLSAVNSGYSLMLINNSTNEGQLITMTDLATMVLNELRNQTFTASELGQTAASTLPAAISSLNSAIALSNPVFSGFIRENFEYVSGGIIELGSLYYVDLKVTVKNPLSATTINIAGNFGKKAPVDYSLLYSSCISKPSVRMLTYVGTSRNITLKVLDSLAENDIISMTGWYLHV